MNKPFDMLLEEEEEEEEERRRRRRRRRRRKKEEEEEEEEKEEKKKSLIRCYSVYNFQTISINLKSFKKWNISTKHLTML